MKFCICTAAILSFFSLSCKNHPSTKDVVKDTIKSEPYYPIIDYIISQVQYIDSTPFAIEKQIFINGKRTDSTLIDRTAFKTLAEEFERPNLNLNNIKPLYTENIYNDLSMNAITFTYDTKDPNQELQQTTVLLNPSTKKVKHIIFKKIRVTGDTIVTINGLWKNNMNFQLNYTYQPKGKTIVEKQIKVIWNRPYENE